MEEKEEKKQLSAVPKEKTEPNLNDELLMTIEVTINIVHCYPKEEWTGDTTTKHTTHNTLHTT